MRILFFILLLISFLQTTILPVNLLLLILVIRSFMVRGKENLYLAFIFGMLISHLQFAPWGFYCLFYLVSVQGASLWSKFPISSHILVIFSYSIVILILNQFATSLVLKSSFNLHQVLIEALIFLPIYLLIRIWEERFTVKPDIVLKI